MNPFPYLVPGLVQFRQRRWLSGLVLAGACVGLVAVLVAGEITLRRTHRRFREVAPRSLARDLWDRKTEAREEALLALLGLSLLGAVEARVGRPRTTADPGGRRAARARLAAADGPEETSADPDDPPHTPDADGPPQTSADPDEPDTPPDPDAPPRTPADV